MTNNNIDKQTPTERRDGLEIDLIKLLEGKEEKDFPYAYSFLRLVKLKVVKNKTK